MRHTFISSLVADARMKAQSLSKENNRHVRQTALLHQKTAASRVIRNILAALLGAAVGLLVIWVTSA